MNPRTAARQNYSRSKFRQSVIRTIAPAISAPSFNENLIPDRAAPAARSRLGIAATVLRMGCFTPEKFSPVQYLQKREQHMKTFTITAPAIIRTQAFVTVQAESEEIKIMTTLPDYLPKESKLVIVGINPSLVAARTGRYYSGRGNQFWPLINDSGLVAERLGCSDAERVTEFGIGLTDLVKRPTKGSDGVSTREFVKGRDVLHRKLEGIDRPRVIAFNGKIAYEKFMGRKCEYGLQKERLYGARVYVLPSTSRRCGRISYRQKTQSFSKDSSVIESRGKWAHVVEWHDAVASCNGAKNRPSYEPPL